MKSRLILSLAAVLVSVLLAGVARAGYDSYLKLEGVDGEKSPPGLPDATQIHSFSLGINTFAETQLYDTTSPTLIGWSVFNHATVAFYQDPNNATAPYEEILLNDLLISSIQTTTIGAFPGEKVTFQFVSPADYLFLALPGVGGSSSPPGRPGVLPIDSLTITDNTFSVHRAVDATSPALAAAFATGAAFSTSSLLVYTDIASETQADLSIVFDHALISSIVTDASGASPEETISFVATDSTVPEPGTTALLALGVLAGVLARRSSGVARPEGLEPPTL